ncbi:sensor histidine kinase [Paenibacillus sp. MMS20-IR301]|uniref:sensor histidine kinase n=1 Tax=Paenibacillus sp. MMS20-IR301 TaxID=2895946 RepID=UPI0028E64479|nr:sensor histidine kinase [Paenibacillus sp. MMS20-IR301]WNS42880.1 sensor histidine kinase [Paenibacillus sp. MMS20-IR301]
MKWRKLSYNRKLFITLLLIASLPVLLLGTIAYKKSSRTLQAQTEQDLQVIATQLNSAIEKQISDFDRFSILPYYMPEAFKLLSQPYVPEDEWGSAELNSQKQLVRLMSAYPSINTSIKGMVLYGMNGAISAYRTSASSTVNREYDASGESWYKAALAQKGGFVVSGVHEIRQFEGKPFQAVTGARLLLDDNMRPLALMALHISPDFIETIIRSSQLRSSVVTVADADNQLVYTSDTQIAGSLLGQLAKGESRGIWTTEGTGTEGKVIYRGVMKQSKYLGWTIYLGKNQNELLRDSRSIRQYTFIIVAVLVIFAAAVAWLMARSLSGPILQLIRSMRNVEQGRFEDVEPSLRQDEIGQLHLSYSRMVKRLHGLIESIADKERQKRKAELYALTLRIQPHFLYNTLNSIRMLAILQQSHQIARLIHSLNRLLQSYMRIQDELLPLSEEIALLQTYAELMDLRYTNTFAIEWAVPEELLDAGIPPMLLQPVLENAIFHASKGLNRSLKIKVGATLAGPGNLLQIEVCDDGIGIPKEQITRLLNDRKQGGTSSIGLNNVNDRVRLRFGPDYGLQLHRLPQGTAVIITLPYDQLTQRSGE